MRKLIGILGVLVVAIVGGNFAVSWWTTGRFMVSTDNAYVHGDISIISAKVQGYVRDVRVKDNQVVQQGDILLTVDDRDYKALVDQAQAGVAAQKATIANIDSQLVLQQSVIGQAEAELSSAQADLVFAQQDYQRFKSLVKDDFVSRQRFNTAEAALKKAEAGVVNTRAKLQGEKDRVAVLETSKAQAQGQLEGLEAALVLAQTNLDHTILRAPVSGVVGNKGVEVGQLVQPGSQLLSVVPLDSVYIVANYKETQLAHIQAGQAVMVEVDAFPDVVLKGQVDSLSPASGAQFSLLPPENATGNFTKVVQRIPVKITLPTDQGADVKLRPGMSVEVSIDTRSAAQAH